ncbi:unnamed protein product [Brassica rapa subsp. trilocularis]
MEFIRWVRPSSFVDHQSYIALFLRVKGKKIIAAVGFRKICVYAPLDLFYSTICIEFVYGSEAFLIDLVAGLR